MAAELGASGEARIEMKPGDLGEVRVSVDGRDVFVGSRWWYSKPSRIVSAVRKAIRDRGDLS